jgi:hypothetical protein
MNMPMWHVEVPPELAEELERSIDGGPIVDDQGRVGIQKKLVARIDRLKVYIYSDEHGPPHFHVVDGAESGSFSIKDCTPLQAVGFPRYIRNIRRWHQKNKQLLIRAWDELRPADCPVGSYGE